ncbi:hypothetical protein P691DRAFT_676691 [Macrolepiota fuliginosa MF-IS2]|uniref:Uncharacterized protein n=1 Tax=Macrolepiota fuliginosa MF-IS2 TaxID=1400762 RepID=A0A9P6BZ33_9AGAR|nr:hypothetical protein P691DRAFT_676691 [Macrolepiota fuliginosa MF-IS2]
MSLYRSSLHPPVFPSQISSYSSLADALNSNTRRQFANPRRRRVPQYKSKIPLGFNPRRPPILFDHFDACGQGVPVHDFITLSTNALAREVIGAHDQVLAGLDIRQLTLRITWQGYECLGWSRSIPASPAISRVQLGATIAMQFWNFIEDVRDVPTPLVEWKLGPNAIKFEQIILLGLYNIFDDTWQADIAVDTPFPASPSF